MKVILLEDVKGIGKKYDVKEVKGGYARNFLIPKNLAKPTSAEALKKLESLQASWKLKKNTIRKELETVAKNIQDRSLIFFLKVDDKNNPFGSVTKEMILSAIRDNAFVTKERVDIKLDRPLKELGEYEVEVEFKKGIKTQLKIEVKPKK